ncbi:uncharacterized protein LOC109726019 [Ananas comosus]|uniref:Uncharacterized protein LOC109726019 n=1 Tax=Ananas comosus TaxID=4615 RepID=A0A6P5GZ74_ANACO|nr:uncharacterized protein LOC109726019 [Ananas comosus]
MASPEEHRISIPDHNAGGSGVSVGPGIINEEYLSSLPSDPPNADEWWIREMEYRIERGLADSTLRPSNFKDETEDKICVSTLHERISQRRSDTEEGLSRPSVVRIGPFHRWHSSSISEDEKWVIVGLMNLLYGLDLRSCLVRIKNQVANARSRYNIDELQRFRCIKDPISPYEMSDERSRFYNDKSFAEMLLLDSYFILFMLTIKLREGPTDYTLMPPTPKFTKEPLKLLQGYHFTFLDIIFNKEEIAPDLLIVDNQIPFFVIVIEELFEELNLDKPLYEYALEFFERIHPRLALRSIDQHSPPKFLHLLHLFHWSRVPQNKYIELIISPSPQQLDVFDWVSQTLNAMELRESATLFEKKTSGSSSPLDITFHRRWFNRIIGVFHIPELHIRDYSSLIFHNLIAFEMQSSTRGRCTMAFSALMRILLQSEEDVKLLRQRRILVSSSMTDRQLIDLFARLSKLTENHQMPYDLFAICDQVQSYHKNLVSRLCGGIIVQYFSKPVVALSVFVAALLFVPTLLQTIYAMIYHS